MADKMQPLRLELLRATKDTFTILHNGRALRLKRSRFQNVSLAGETQRDTKLIDVFLPPWFIRQKSLKSTEIALGVQAPNGAGSVRLCTLEMTSYDPKADVFVVRQHEGVIKIPRRYTFSSKVVGLTSSSTPIVRMWISTRFVRRVDLFDTEEQVLEKIKEIEETSDKLVMIRVRVLSTANNELTIAHDNKAVSVPMHRVSAWRPSDEQSVGGDLCDVWFAEWYAKSLGFSLGVETEIPEDATCPNQK